MIRTALAAALVLIAAIPPAKAQWIVFDPTNYAQNALTAARELQQVDNGILSLQNQAAMLVNQARNLASLPYSSLGVLAQSSSETELLLSEAQQIGYSTGAIDQAFVETYPQTYASGVSSPQMIADAQTRWQNARAGFQDAMRVQAGAVQNLGAASTQTDALLASSQAAAGALQAAQSGNQLIAVQATELADLTAVMASLARAQSLDGAKRLESQAQAQQQLQNFLNYGAGYQPEDILARLIRKTLYIGVFAFILGNFSNLAQIIYNSFSSLGLKAGGGTITAQQLLQPGQLAEIGIDAGKPILSAISGLVGFTSFFDNFVEIAILLIAWLIVIISFFVIAIQLFVSLIEFKLTTLAGFVLVPFGLFGRTAFLAEKVLGNVVASGVKILVLAVIVGIGATIFCEFTTVLNTRPTIADALTLILASLTLLGLTIFGPGIANGLIAGGPQLGAGAAIGTGLAVAGIGGAGIERRSHWRSALAIGARHHHALGGRGRCARPGAGHRSGNRRLHAHRSANRLVSRPLHQRNPRHSGRSRGTAAELARCLQLRHRQGRAGPQRVCAHERCLFQGRQGAGHGRDRERHPRLGRQFSHHLDRTPLRR